MNAPVDSRAGWSRVLTSMGRSPDGVEEAVTFSQCPRCVALVWSVNTQAHDAWHAQQDASTKR